MGTDLYINFTLQGKEGFSKAILVQSKWEDAVAVRDLSEQCRKMLKVSPAAYAWLYGPRGVRVLDAKTVTNRSSVESLGKKSGRTVASLVKEILDCKEGDPEYAIPDVVDRRAAVTAMLEDLDAKVGVSLTVEPPDHRQQ